MQEAKTGARRFIVMGASRPTSTGLFQTAIKQSSILHKVQSRNSSTTTTSSIISNVNSAQSSSSAAGEALMKIGDLKSHGLCNMTPPGMIEGLLEMIHVTGGLSWCATIIGTTFAVRLLLMPLMISSQRLMARLQMLKPQTDEMKVKMDVAKGRGDTEEMKRIQMLMMELYSKHDANPLGGLKVGLISGPIMASFFLALRDISALKMPALTSGGMLWFTDLSVADPYYVLPALACGSFLYAFEKGVETGQQQPAFMKNIMRGLCVIGFPFMASYSSALSLYFFTNSICAVGMSVLFQNHAVRRALNLPILIATTVNSQQKAIDVAASVTKERQKSGAKDNNFTFRDSLKASIDAVKDQHPNHPIVKAMGGASKDKGRVSSPVAGKQKRKQQRG